MERYKLKDKKYCMIQNNKYEKLPWVTDEMVKQQAYRDGIVARKDFSALFQLDDNAYFSIVLRGILLQMHDNNPDSLNSVQLNLLICMLLEDAGKADSILGFLQEDYPQYSDKVVHALNDIGAIKSSELIREAIELLPSDGSWFYDSASDDEVKLMHKIDSSFSDYPDGFLCDLYRPYAEKNKEQLINKNIEIKPNRKWWMFWN